MTSCELVELVELVELADFTTCAESATTEGIQDPHMAMGCAIPPW